MDSILASHPTALGSILRIPKNKLMLQRDLMALLKNSEQRLDNVNRTHLVLASGKLVLQKNHHASERRKIIWKERGSNWSPQAPNVAYSTT